MYWIKYPVPSVPKTYDNGISRSLISSVEASLSLYEYKLLNGTRVGSAIPRPMADIILKMTKTTS